MSVGIILQGRVENVEDPASFELGWVQIMEFELLKGYSSRIDSSPNLAQEIVPMHSNRETISLPDFATQMPLVLRVACSRYSSDWQHLALLPFGSNRNDSNRARIGFANLQTSRSTDVPPCWQTSRSKHPFYAWCFQIVQKTTRLYLIIQFLQKMRMKSCHADHGLLAATSILLLCGWRDTRPLSLAGPFQVIRLCTHSKLQQIHLPSKELDFSWAGALQGTADLGDPHASLHILYQAGNVSNTYKFDAVLGIWVQVYLGRHCCKQTKNLLWRLVPCYDSSLKVATGWKLYKCIDT